MSRRHHGNRPHRSGPHGSAEAVRSGLDAPPAADPRERLTRPAAADAPVLAPDGAVVAPEAPAAVPIAPVAPDAPHAVTSPATSPAAAAPAPVADPPPARPAPASQPGGPTNGAGHGPPPEAAACTAPQLRRFIKSRPYVPMHELRRRFGINGTEDDVSAIELGDRRRIYVGLPPREGSLLGELLRGGDIGYELSLDPRTPIVIGLYPMRPVARS